MATTPDSQISLRFATVSHFRFTGHFETSAPNDPKMTFNTMRSKVVKVLYGLLLLPRPKFYSGLFYGHEMVSHVDVLLVPYAF